MIRARRLRYVIVQEFAPIFRWPIAKGRAGPLDCFAHCIPLNAFLRVSIRFNFRFLGKENGRPAHAHGFVHQSHVLERPHLLKPSTGYPLSGGHPAISLLR